ncbi:hypothetical protein SAMN05444339_10340 [Loktanella atrilutea]|uniref:Uncharacterized protein n=1 Tax=Loktanella atrilutea TaxID=366533 RepID=A0A1M4Y8S6_LOKAT|nr:hypothetical protein [Loktanella atrilutea]SHF02227.1 hypothetical protein SAMN05444339_10340 [Loktanella atrilutea]
MTGKTNDAMTGNDKAVEANERQKNRPEGADHLPLKDDKAKADDKS